jgi:hypothetical protein
MLRDKPAQARSTVDRTARILAVRRSAFVYPAVRVDSVIAVRDVDDRRMPSLCIRS